MRQRPDRAVEDHPEHPVPRRGGTSTSLAAADLRVAAAPTTPAYVSSMQRLAGNRAVATVMRQRETDSTEAEGKAGCACKGGGKCSCQRVVQRSKDGPAEKPVDYSQTHSCNFGEGVRVFASWAFATAKLFENLPALRLSYATGLATDNLKRNLKKNFNVEPTDKATRKKVLKALIPGYEKVLGVMGAGLASVRCGGEHCRDGDFAYVFPKDKDNVIYLCNTMFAKNTPTKDLGCTWVHELAHKSLGLKDVEYYSAGQATTLDPDAALTNADCWGNFMVSYD